MLMSTPLDIQCSPHVIALIRYRDDLRGNVRDLQLGTQKAKRFANTLKIRIVLQDQI